MRLTLWLAEHGARGLVASERCKLKVREDKLTYFL